jgi:membrane protease YdiL (CAAX protease family)
MTRARSRAVCIDGTFRLAQTGKSWSHGQKRKSSRYHAHIVQPPPPQATSLHPFAPYALILGLGPVGAWVATHIGMELNGTACHSTALLTLLLLAPAAEETVFRLGLQRWIDARLSMSAGPLSMSNLLTAVVFGSLHALHHGTPLMVLTMFPSLVCGWVWENNAKQLRYPVLVHAWYNLCLVISGCL